MEHSSVTRAVTAAERAAFLNDGVVVLRAILDLDWIDHLRTKVDEIMSHARGSGSFDAGSEGFFQKSLVWQEERLFHKFLAESGFGVVPAALLGSKVINLFEDTILSKDPGSPRPTPWHQDLPYYSLSGRDLCTAWVPMDVVDKQSGAMTFVRGSHRWDKWFRPVAFSPGKTINCQQFEDIEEGLQRARPEDFISFELEPGDLSVHHGLVLHAAGPNNHPTRARRAYAVSFAGDDIRVADNDVRPPFLKDAAVGKPLSGALFPNVLN